MAKSNFFKRIWNFIEKVFGGLGAKLRKVIRVAHDVVENVKTFIDSPTADVITALIPGNADDGVKNILRASLPRILSVLAGLDGDPETVSDDKLILAIKKINSASPEVRRVFYIGLASLVTELLSDGEISWSDAIAVQEYFYKFEAK